MLSQYARIKTGFSRVNLGLAIVGAALLFFAASIIFIEVLSRGLTGSSQLWVIEVSEYSLLYITLLGAPYLLEKNQHVTLDLVYAGLPTGPKVIVRLLNSTIGFVLCAILTIVGIDVVLDQIDTGVRTATVMAPPRYLVSFALPVGMLLLSVQFLFQGIDALRREGL